MKQNLILPGERIDELYANQVKIIQSPEVFSFSLDAVLLAYFAQPIKKAQGQVVDLCAGNGAVGLFLSTKTNAHIKMIEIQPRLAQMAQRSVLLNELSTQIEVLNFDLNDAYQYLKKDSIDTVTCNPPYFENLPDSKKNPNEHLALARHEITVTLAQVIEKMSGLLKMGGKCYLVHRPQRLLEILDEMRKQRLAPKKIQLVYPKANKEANMVLIEAIKDGRPGGVRFLEPLIVYEQNDEYTAMVKEILYGN